MQDLAILQGPYLQDILHQPEALENTLAGLEAAAELRQIAARLNKGEFDRVVLTGMGSSFHALHSLNLELIDQGFTPVMVETSELVHYNSRFFDSKTLFIAVSQSGRSAEVVRLAQAERKHCTVIGVTNTPDSPLARCADAVVFTRAGHEFSVSCKTYVAALMALKWLGDLLCERDLRDSRKELQCASPAVDQYLGLWRDHVAEMAGILAGVRHLFLVGRGASLATAGTGALIVKESAHFHAEGMSSAAFRHGPFEMLSAETFVLVFAGDARTCELNQRLWLDIRKKGGRTELADKGAFLPCCRVADHGPGIRQMLEILPVQMVTLALAAQAEREPGRFEHASKVTTTE